MIISSCTFSLTLLIHSTNRNSNLQTIQIKLLAYNHHSLFYGRHLLKLTDPPPKNRSERRQHLQNRFKWESDREEEEEGFANEREREGRAVHESLIRVKSEYMWTVKIRWCRICVWYFVSMYHFSHYIDVKVNYILVG